MINLILIQTELQFQIPEARSFVFKLRKSVEKLKLHWKNSGKRTDKYMF